MITKLRNRQQSVLDELALGGGQWNGGGWVWGSRSETATVLESLSRRGMTKLTRDDLDPSNRHYEITPLGRLSVSPRVKEQVRESERDKQRFREMRKAAGKPSPA